MSNERKTFLSLDPNRIRTDAEIELFADVFAISIEEARRILMKDKNVRKKISNHEGEIQPSFLPSETR